jgi:hypothetical protein
MTDVWQFDKQLKVGQQGERLLLKHWPHPVRKHAELKGPDFVDSRGVVLELKTDTYPLEKTGNCFMERWGDLHLKKPGGPWRALDQGVDVLVYLFLSDRQVFIFEDLPGLVKRLDRLTQTMYIHTIPNRAWTTGGYKVPRAALADLWRQEDWSKVKKRRSKG